MAKSLLEQYEDWKLKKQKEEQQASQPKYTIPDTGSILEQYQSYKQQRQAEEQKAASAKRINNPSHLGNVMIAGAVQNTQKKQAEAARVAKEDETRRLKQEEKQSWNDYVQRLTDQYMPVRPDPIPQVDTTKKYGPASSRSAMVASAGVSDAPFNAMSEAERDRREREERDHADREAYQAALERANLGRGGKLNESSGRGGDLNLPSTGRGGALENNPANGWDYDANKAQDLRRVELEDELAQMYQLRLSGRSGMLPVQNYKKDTDIFPAYTGTTKLIGRPAITMGGEEYGTLYSITIQDDDGQWVNIPTIYDGKLHTENEAVAHYREIGEHLGKYQSLSKAENEAQALSDAMGVYVQNRDAKTPQVETAGQTIEELTARRAEVQKDLETYDTVLKWPVGRQDVEGQQNFANAQALRPQALKELDSLNEQIRLKEKEQRSAEDTARVEALKVKYEAAPDWQKGEVLAELKAAEYNRDWNAMTTLEQTGVWLGDRAKKALYTINDAVYAIPDLIADVAGIDRLQWSKNNKAALGAVQQNIEQQAKNTGWLINAAGDVVSEGIRMIPTILIASMTGGASLAAQGAANIATAGAGTGAKVAQATAAMLKNPAFVNSFFNMFGLNLSQAREAGVDPATAVSMSWQKALPSALIEMSGGYEKAAERGRGWLDWLIGSLEEGREEVVQGITDTAVDKTIGNVFNLSVDDVVSLTNQESIVSGARAAEEFGLGAVTAGVMGGAQIGLLKGMDAMTGNDPRRNETFPSDGSIELNKKIAENESKMAALEAAARERSETEARDSEAWKRYNELVQAVNSSLPAESATRALIAEEGPIDTKRMEAVAKGALSEYSELLKANPSDEMAGKAQALNKAIEALYTGIKTDRGTTVDKYTAGLDEAVKSGIKGKTGDEAVSYAKGYGTAHALGQYGVSNDTIAKVTAFEDAQKAADEGRVKWDIGLPKAKAKAAELRKTLPVPGKGGVTYHSNVKQDALTTGQRDQIGLLEQVAKPMGYKFVMVEFEKDAAGNYVTDKGKIAPNGYFRDTDGTIYIDVNAGKVAGRMVEDTIIPQTAGHELTHYLKANAPELFRAYGAAVIEELSTKGQDINALIAQKIGRAKQADIGVDVAVEEVIADASSMMLQNTQAVQALAKTNPGLFEKITEWVKDFIERVRKAFSKVEGTPEAKAIMNMRDGVMKYADSLQKMWDDMAVSVAQAKLDEKPAPAQDASLEAYNDIVARKSGRVPFTVDVGDESLTNYLNDRIAKTQQGLGDAGRKAFSDFMDKVDETAKKKPVLAFGLYRDALDVWDFNYNVGKTGIVGSMSEIQDALERFNDETINGISKSGEQDAHPVAARGVQATEEQAQNTENVPKQAASERYQERDSDDTPLTAEQIEYFKDSKVRDEQGRLLKVYHGTEKAGFHEFSETDDIGYFFTNSSRLASTYSGRYKDYAPSRIDTWERAKAYAEKNDIDFEENDGEYIIDGDTFAEEELNFAEDFLNELTSESKANYNVYLNLKDPYVIDAGGSNWSAVIEQSGTMKTFSELTKAEKKRISENMWIEVGELYDITDDYGNSLAAFDVDNLYCNYPRTTREIVQEAVDMGADGVIIRNVEDGGKYSYGGDTGDVYVALNPEQIKSTTNLTPTSSPDIRYQERDPDYRTKRDILAGAFDSVAQTESEKRNLKEYKNLIGSLNRMEEEARGLRQANTAERKKPDRDKAVIEKNTKRIAEIEDRINNLDKRLLKMQNAAPLQNVLKREVDYYKKQQNMINRQQLEKYRAERAETSIKQRHRADITKGVKTLNTMLMNESDQKHIPEGFKGAVLDFLRLFTDDTSVFDYKRLSVLKEMYDALVTLDSELAGMYDFDIAGDIADAARMLEGKRLSQLTEAELESLRDIVAHFNHIVKNENQIFTQKRSVKTTDAAEEGLSEYGKKAKEMRLALLNGKNPIAAINKFLTSKNIKPVYFFKRVGGILQELFDDIRAAQGKWAFRMSEDRNFFRDTVQKYNYYKWADDGQLTFTTARGDQITLTRDQALELYAINKREKTNKQQGAEHLAIGGFVYEDAVKVKKKGALGVPMTYEINAGENHPLTDSDLDQIGKWLTNEQRAFADEMVNYLSTVMGDRGNEVSLAMYGIRKYTEKYYFPYKSASNYLHSHQGGAQDDSAIKHRSFTKRTTVSANNPVVLTGFTKVWADHVQNMNLYNAMAVPLDNFNRVYNYRIRGDKDSTKAQSVKAALEAAYGKEANAYIKQLLNDVNGGIRPDKGDAEARKLMSLWKKGAVFASLSVVVQQPSAIGRALALVDPKYFRKGYTKAGYEEMMKWSGTANIKAMGRFDANMGMTAADWLTQREYTGMNEKAKAFAKDGSFRDDVLSWLPQKADEMTWTALWEAVKRETASKYGNLIGSDAFMRKAADRFDEVVDYTQVYDSVLSRSEVMRSQSALAQMVTSFMAEPTTAYNMLLDAIANRKNKGMKNYVKPGRALGAFAVSVMLNSILKAMVTAGRDDDEKYTYLEKYLRKVSGSIADELNPLGLVPYGRDILSLWDGYDVERADMSLIGDLINAAKKASKTDTPVLQRMDVLAGAIGNALGIPYKNVRRDIQGVYNVLANTAPMSRQSVSGAKYSILEGLPWFDASRAGYARKLYSAITKGDAQEEAGLREQISKIVKKESDINTELRKAISTEFEEERLEPRIALQHMIELTELKEIKGKIGDWYKTGLITEDVAEQLLVEFTADDQPNERYKTIEGWNFSKDPENEGESYSTYKPFYEAIDSGKDLRAVVNTYMDPKKYGATKSTLSGRITDNYKEQYIETYKRSKSEASALKSRLLNAYVILGYDRDKKSKDIDAWLK